MKRYTLCVRAPFLCVLLALAGMGIFAKRGALDWRRMVENNESIAKQIEGAKEQRDDLEQQLKALQTSTFAQEQAVRQHLGYLREQELVLEFP